MKSLILPTLVTFALADSHALSTQYSTEQSFRVEIESSFSMEMVDFSMERDGEPVEGGFGGGDMRTEQTRNLVMVDTILEIEDGAPKQIRRAFETISDNSVMSRGGEDMDNARECPLEGVVLELTLDGDTASAEVVDGDAPDDDALLEGHRVTLALDALLPEDGVEADDSWEIEGEALVRALGFDIEAALYPTPEREEGEGRGEGRGGGRRRGGMRGGGGGGAERYFANASWDAEATLGADVEEYDGIECHVIEIKAEATGELPEREPGGRDRRDGMPHPMSPVLRPENSFEFEIEGKLYFSTKGGHPVHLELEGEISTESLRESNRRDSLMVISTAQEGTFKYSVDITRVKNDSGSGE